MTVRPAKTQISLGIRPIWSETSLSARKKIGSLATYWAHREDPDQTGYTVILLVLSWGGSFRANIKQLVCRKIYREKYVPAITSLNGKGFC